MQCLKCGNENSDNAKFCRGCGAKLEEIEQVTTGNFVECSKCGHAIESGKKFCPKCGTSVITVEPISVPVSAATMLDISPAPPVTDTMPPAVPLANQANVQPTPSKSDRTKLAGAAIAVILLSVAGGGWYWYHQMPEKVSPSTINTALVNTADSGAQTNGVMEALPVQQATPSIALMLKAAYANDDNGFFSAKQSLDKLNKPPRGNRKAARTSNSDGLARLKDGDISGAVASLTRATEEDPSDQEVWSNLAYAYLQANNLDEANRATTASLALAPERASAWGTYGVILARQGNQVDAVGAFLVAYRFSRNQQKTIEYLQNLLNEDKEPQVKAAAGDALERLPISTGQAAAQLVQEAERRRQQTEAVQHAQQANEPVMVRIPGKNYEMGKFEVTQKEWRAIMGNNPSYFSSCGDTCPVENVSWNDAQQFIQKLNAKTGKQYRLPTSAEWQYACYGGSQTEYCGGNNLDAVGWFNGNSNGQTHPVGQKQANGYGLYDMTGNVWEWISEYSDDNGLLRGGSWYHDSQYVRPVVRDGEVLTTRRNYFGFRLARTLP
jgi:formylglycine-generating enzyme required for sulfatase activity/Flp pilus assembly protein TadD